MDRPATGQEKRSRSRGITRSLPTPVARRLDATDDRGGNARALAQHELGRAGDLVGDGDHRRAELVAGRVARAAKVTESRDPGHPERDIGRALPPRTPERVADDDAGGDARQLCQALAERRSGGVGVERQQDHRSRALRVRGIDAGRGADEAVPRARDHERRPGAHDLGRLAQDHLHLPRVAFVAGELDGPRGRLDLVQADDAALDLRHRLLGHDDDVAVLEAAHARAGLGQQPPEVVPLLELGNARQADHPHLAGAPILVRSDVRHKVARLSERR